MFILNLNYRHIQKELLGLEISGAPRICYLSERGHQDFSNPYFRAHSFRRSLDCGGGGGGQTQKLYVYISIFHRYEKKTKNRKLQTCIKFYFSGKLKNPVLMWAIENVKKK